MAGKKLPQDQVKLIADSLLPAFTPKDHTENTLTFNFTAEGSTYRVEYMKKEGRSWEFQRYEEVKIPPGQG